MAIVAREIPFSTSVTHPRSAPLWRSSGEQSDQSFALRGVLLVACDRASVQALRRLASTNWVSAFAVARSAWLRLVVASSENAAEDCSEAFDRCLSDLRQRTARAYSAENDERVLGESVILLSTDARATRAVAKILDGQLARFEVARGANASRNTIRRWVLQFDENMPSRGRDIDVRETAELASAWSVLRCRRAGTQQQPDAELVNGLIPFVSAVASDNTYVCDSLRNFAGNQSDLSWSTHFDGERDKVIRTSVREHAHRIAHEALEPLGSIATRHGLDSDVADENERAVSPITPQVEAAPVAPTPESDEDEQPTIAQATGAGTINLALAGAIAGLSMLAYAVFATPTAGGSWTSVSVWGAFLVIVVMFLVAWIALGARAGYQLAARPAHRVDDYRSVPSVEASVERLRWQVSQVRKSARNQAAVEVMRVEQIGKQQEDLCERWVVRQVGGTRDELTSPDRDNSFRGVSLELDCGEFETTITHQPYKLTLRGHAP